MLTRRPTNVGFGPVPDDYSIREDGQTIGRIYKAQNFTTNPWVWFIHARHRRPAETQGEADSLESALEAFKASWEG